jgi:hypothetical protein
VQHEIGFLESIRADRTRPAPREIAAGIGLSGRTHQSIEKGEVMKNVLLALAASAAATIAFSSLAQAQCTTIQDGTLLTSAGDVIETGFDNWGYNYQAHMFNGTYCDAYRDATWCQPYKDIELLMKWNDAWLSNKDCDDNGVLDRHYGFDSYIGSGAWTTNHQKGVYIDDRGKKQRWSYFVKIVAAPADATLTGPGTGGMWYAADGSEIGSSIWNEFAIIQQIYNDTGTGEHGVEYLSPHSAGFGRYSPAD